MAKWRSSKVAKYRAKPTHVDGIRFASRKEARRYEQLRILLRAQKIMNLELQPRFPLEVNGQLVTTYVADFRYYDVERSCTVVEDVKGIRTPVYVIKRNLMLALHGIEILET